MHVPWRLDTREAGHLAETPRDSVASRPKSIPQIQDTAAAHSATRNSSNSDAVAMSSDAADPVGEELDQEILDLQARGTLQRAEHHDDLDQC